MRLRHGLSLALATSLLVQALNVATGVLLARGLGPADRGALAAALLWPAMLAAVASLGLPEATTYRAARARAGLGGLVGTGAAIALAQAALVGAVGVLVIPLALGGHGPGTTGAALLYLAFAPLHLVTVTLMGVLNGLHRFHEYNLVRAAYAVVAAVAVVTLAAAGALGVRAAVVGYLVAGGVTAVLAVALVTRAGAGRPSVRGGEAAGLLGFGARSHTSTLAATMNERLDQVVISIFLAPAGLGLYVIAVTLTSLTSLVGTSVAAVALPTLARLEGDERAAAAARLVAVTLAAGAAVTVPLLVAAPILVTAVFGEAFAGAVAPARVLLVAGVVLALVRVLEATLKAAGAPLAAGKAELVGLGATAVALAALLPALGILGAALASLVAYCCAAAWGARRTARALGVRPAALLTSALPLPRPAPAAALGGER